MTHLWNPVRSGQVGLEHLQRRPEQVPGRVDARDAGPHPAVDGDEAVGAAVHRERPCEARPPLQYQGPPAQAAQDGRTEPARAAAAQEDRVEVRAAGPVDVHGRLAEPTAAGVVDQPPPLRHVQASAVDVHEHSAVRGYGFAI
jgi:hypothetical protein